MNVTRNKLFSYRFDIIDTCSLALIFVFLFLFQMVDEIARAERGRRVNPLPPSHSCGPPCTIL